MTKIDALEFTGRSGRVYPFGVYIWATKFKAFPAVYVVTERLVEPNAAPVYVPVFVASTSDLSRIFDDHPHKDCFELYYANTIAVMREEDEAARGRIERDLSEALQAPCNSGDAS